MNASPPDVFDRPRIVVADEDPAVVAFIVHTLREDGNAVFHAYDTLSATQLAFSLDVCHLLISNTRVEGAFGIDLIRSLRERLPALPMLYLANIGLSTPELEAQLPADVPILREPFTADQLRAVVRPLMERYGRD
jgi:DNA-binding NtrC family response regulator